MSYDANWLGLDRGREGLLDPTVWRGILTVLSSHEGESIRDPHASLYTELETRFPETEWISSHDKEHNFFRDYQQAWTLAGVLVPTRETDGVVHLTEVGRDLVDNKLSLRAVWIHAMASHQEGKDKPFSILASAFLELGSKALTLSQIYFGIEQGWRPGDGPVANAIDSALLDGTIEPTPSRRLRQILKLMTMHGVLKTEGANWAAKDTDLLTAIVKGITIIAPAKSVPASVPKPLGEEVQKTETEVEQLATVVATLPLPLRETVLRSIAIRRGQPKFRRLLLGLYGSKCAMSGWDAVVALEAAHIVPIAEDADHGATNGLLLRADLHTLFDLHYIGVDPKAWTVAVSPFLMPTQYGTFNGAEINLPMSVADRPSTELLSEHLSKVTASH
ncbi:MAG: hypothetical protein JW395_0161 [Nitrospira sp.]|nr:hypothetical protein [Nitrospira sp.]